MDSSDNEAMKRLRLLSECCICLNTYTDPRLLPCFHTACLKCFEDLQLKNEVRPGDFLPCPLCRKDFSIPEDGMTGLQKNFFIESLMEVTRAFNVENESVLCNTCSIMEDEGAINSATKRCLNCCENYCTRCSKMHKSQKLTRDHKIVEINTEFKEDEIRNMFPIRKCPSHSDKDLDYYCSDCKTVVCVSCFVEDHQTHKCKDVKKIDEDFRRIIENELTKLSDYTRRLLSKKFDMEKKKEDYRINTKETESTIKAKNQQLKTLIDQHTEDVLNELSTMKQKHEKQMEADLEEIERKLTILESFVTYCTELKSKGSPSDVCDSADSLISRADELIKENDEYLRAPSKPLSIEFFARYQNSLPQTFGNVIGKLSESTKFVESYAFVFGANIDESDSTTKDIIKINLNQSEEVSSLEHMPVGMNHGTTAAVHCNSIFVTGVGKKRKEIWRFDATSSNWWKCASLVQGRENHSVAFVDHILYICGGIRHPSEDVASEDEALDDVEAYDTLNDECSFVGKLVFAVHFSGNSCLSYNSSLYIFGGVNSNYDAVSSVQVFDTKLNTCTLLSEPMPTTDKSLRAVLWESNAILLGSEGCFTYNFVKEKWKERDEFKSDVEDFGLTISNGLLFIIGGNCYIEDADGNDDWICRDDVRCVPVVNILQNQRIQWRHHATLPKLPFVFCVGK